MSKKFFWCIFILACSSKAYSACTAVTNSVIFTATMTSALSDNSYLQLSSQSVQASSPQPISSCTGNGISTFLMQPNTDLNMSSPYINPKDGYTYFQIPSSFISTLPASTTVYIAFSIKDNQDSAEETWVSNATTAYQIYSGSSNTRGIRLQNVRILISGIGNAQGTYTVNPLKLGQFSAKDSSKTASTNINLSPFNFTITKSTCVVNGGAAINVTLPTVRTSDFTSVGQTLGETTFPVNVSGCNASDVNKSLVALLTDNNDPNQSSSIGLLKNTGANNSQNVSVQIIDGVSNNPIQIAPKLIGSSSSFFSFGNIGSGGTVSKSFKARYYSNVLPVPATNVNAQATITLIYN